jgi:hypothetical protein
MHFKYKSGKETIKPPSKAELTDASKQLRAGHSSAARTMADKSVSYPGRLRSRRRRVIPENGGGVRLKKEKL